MGLHVLSKEKAKPSVARTGRRRTARFQSVKGLVDVGVLCGELLGAQLEGEGRLPGPAYVKMRKGGLRGSTRKELIGDGGLRELLLRTEGRALREVIVREGLAKMKEEVFDPLRRQGAGGRQ